MEIGTGRSRRATAAVVCVFALLVTAGCSTGSDAGNVSLTRVGQLIAAAHRKAAPPLAGITFDDKKLNLSADRGKVIVLNFWASWCTPCRVEAPDMESVYKSEASHGLRIVGVDVKDTRSRAAYFIKNRGLTYPVLWDPDSKIALTMRSFPVATIPATLVIDRQGRVAALYAQAVLRTDLLSVVKPLLTEPAK